ncbi:GntR family transcriptional regulator [Stappia sp. ES.058]|uniref:GntR family transcriptional regulator n=1 Tax=Stappia sp. ES.058 TaxID=1881061 RepID=UPI00087925E9|nr:GntR family transcriptional regulator [Stappia sp. ES.058]SDT90112.1 DNA-binding transcriptional regulator, GntR family [Stappia sp. ES.058]
MTEMPVSPFKSTATVTDAPAPRKSVRDAVEQSVRAALLSGRFVPGRSVTLRGLAQELGVSPMPVREAVRALSAGNALEIRSNGRIQVPQMTQSRLSEILTARLLLEPELAFAAAANLDASDATALRKIDDRVDESLSGGDAETYMQENFAFHFHIYRAARSQVLMPLVESLWLQFAPFMRTVYGRVGTAALDDHHKEAIAAVHSRDAGALREAVAADIRCGMDLLDRSAGDGLAESRGKSPD